MDENQIKTALAQLLEIHRRIDAWDLANPAGSPADAAAKARLSARQNTILLQFNEASAQILALVGKDVSGPAAQLGALSDQITATADDIAEVETVIAIADQVIAAAAQIVAMAA